jgi:hypothetical protein
VKKIWLALYRSGSGFAWVYENNPGIYGKDDSPNDGRAVSSQYWAGLMPEEFGSSTTSSYIYSICANYTAAEQQEVELIGNTYMFTAGKTKRCPQISN